MRYGNMDLVQTSGANNSVYLIPADGPASEVFVWGTVGAGCPEPAWHHRWLCVCRVSATAVPDEVEAVLRAHEAELVELAGFYRGAKWNGNNHVGSWGGEADRDRMDRLCEKIGEAVGSARTYWEASDWFAPVTLYDVVTSDLELGELVANEVANANADAALDADDVRKWLLGAAAKWLEKHDDDADDDERDAKLRERLQNLLQDDDG